MEPVLPASRAQKGVDAHHRRRAGVPRKQIRQTLSSLQNRGRNYLDKFKVKATGTVTSRRSFQEKVSHRSTQSSGSTFSSGSWALRKPEPTPPSELESIFSIIKTKLLDQTAFTQGLPVMKRSSTRDFNDSSKRTKHDADAEEDDSCPKGSPRLSDMAKRFMNFGHQQKSPTESSDAPNESNLGLQADARGLLSEAGEGGVSTPKPVCSMSMAETQEPEQQPPDVAGSSPKPLMEQPHTVKVPVRQTTTSSVGQASSVDLSLRRLSQDTLSAEVFSRPESTVSTAPSTYDSPSRMMAPATRQGVLMKKAMSSSCSLSIPMDPILHRESPATPSELGGADHIELGDNWVLVQEPAELTAYPNEESVQISDRNWEICRQMTLLKLGNSKQPERTDSGICDIDIDLDPGMSARQSSPGHAFDANARGTRLVIRRASTRLSHMNDASPSSSLGPESLERNQLSLPVQSPNPNQTDGPVPNNDLSVREQPSLSTISEVYSDRGFSPSKGMSPTMPSSYTLGPGNGLGLVASYPSVAPSHGSSRMDGASSPIEQQTTPGTSVGGHVEADADHSDDSEDEDDYSVMSEDTDESLVEAFVATTLDPRLLSLTMILNDRIRLFVLSRVQAWISTATQGQGEEAQGTPSSSQAPDNNNNNSRGWGDSSSNSQLPNSKRALDSGNGDDAGGGDGDDNSDKRPRGNGDAFRPPKEDGPRLACPWAKRFPEQATTACQAGWPTVHRVKDHLYKKHSQPIHCARCFMVFKTREALASHIRQEMSCELRKDHPGHPGIDETMKAHLKSRKDLKTLSEEERWVKVWKIMFPNVECPSAFYDLSCIENLFDPKVRERYRDFLRRELPTRINSNIYMGLLRSRPDIIAQLLTDERMLSQIILQAVWDAFEAVLPSLTPNEARNQALGVPTAALQVEVGGEMAGPSQVSSGPSFDGGDNTQNRGDMSEFSDLSFLGAGMADLPGQDLGFGTTFSPPGDWQPQQGQHF